MINGGECNNTQEEEVQTALQQYLSSYGINLNAGQIVARSTSCS
jgi:hypothetical protein